MTKSKSKVHLIISIDTECDKGPSWLIREPMSFENILDGVPEFFTPLFKQYHLKPTYLLSPEVLLNDRCSNLFRNLENAEIGSHLHSEFIEPESQMSANRSSIPQLAYSPEIEFQKLANLCELFKEKMGYAPKSFRAGRWGISKSSLPFLEQLGYIVDSSVCSFRTHTFDQGKANFWGAPLQPYHPSEKDYRKKGNMNLLEVPATLGNRYLMYWPKFILRKMDDKKKMHKKLMRKIGLNPDIKWLRPYKSSAEEMISLSEAYISKYGKSKKPVVLNMMFHSNEILPGMSPYVQTKEEQVSYIESLKILFEYLGEHYNFKGIGLSEVETLV